jgi:hypothetical protein
MKNYIVRPSENDGDFVWSIIETQTNQLIKYYVFEEEASTHARFLNNGGAFNGFTPNFMLLEVAISDNINDQFIFQVA